MENETWFFDAEREKQKTPIDKSLIGKYFKVTKLIARLGYLYSYLDFIGQEKELAVQELVNKLSKERYSPTYFTEESIVCLKKNIQDWFEKDGVPSSLKYRARGILLNKKYKESGIPKYRHIWYSKQEIAEWEQFKIIGIKHCWVGEYVPPSCWTSGYETIEYDCDPGGLNNAIHHSVYVAKSNNIFDETVYIHPLDIIQETNQSLNAF